VTFAIAAAGTGGHVYPGLAVGEALVAGGVERADVLFVGGSRLEAQVYPAAGFPFLEVELRGLRRSLSLSNLGIPLVVYRATRRIDDELRRRRVGVLLGMGGYVTIPAALAARRAGVPLAVAEQNATAGLGNRVAGRMAARRFGAFPDTEGLGDATWVGNPVRREIAEFDRDALRPASLAHFGLDDTTPVLGVFGGSLGAGAVNDAVAGMLARWAGPAVQVLHLAGPAHAERLAGLADDAPIRWVVVDFERHMDRFYAACDLVVSRAGGAVAELTATGTPAILVPGRFGSGGHQEANAAALVRAGAARVVDEGDTAALEEAVRTLLLDRDERDRMSAASAEIARPDAATVIARALVDLHG
jgi:UDP-N-acetylglucosamine--N-acetylmuramyl-(pentapeptide) pyrophosphoryl-undecaprenol N-acetylglucosamine transferase